MLRPTLRVVRNEAQQSAQIFLYGIVGDYWDWENESPVTARNLQRRLSELSDIPVIHIHLSGPGGDVHEGLLICNIIRASKKEIHTWNDGICASMMEIIHASVPIARRHAAKASLTMIHKASTFAWGNSDDLRDTADMLDKHDDVLIEILSDAISTSAEKVKSMWFDGKDHWFTAQEGEAAGLFSVEDYEIQAIPENPTKQPLNQIAAFFKKPSNNTNNTDMGFFSDKFKTISALAKVAAADRTPEHFQAVKDELEAEGIDGVTIVPDKDLAETIATSEKVPGLETQVTDLGIKVANLEKTISDQKILLGKPAEETTLPITDKTDSTGTPPKVDDQFETSFDRELKKARG